MKPSRLNPWFLVWLAGGLLMCPPAASTGRDRILWKPVVNAQLKLDGKPVQNWNVYRATKWRQLVLVQLGRRHLMLDTKTNRVWELDPGTIKPRGKDFESPPLPESSRPIPTSDWVVRDVGPADLIRVRLGDYGRVLEVQLPHPIDLRALY